MAKQAVEKLLCSATCTHTVLKIRGREAADFNIHSGFCAPVARNLPSLAMFFTSLITGQSEKWIIYRMILMTNVTGSKLP